ncbi:MAG: YHYH protein [Planctomycetota bacterium]|jgi:hypothetical protein|nr:YHYH protein [Planctomycetota bacterium]MDP6941621.1 YHYH protein [Planctomycetota bacterium]
MRHHIPHIALALFVSTATLVAQTDDPAVTSWRLNLDGTKGHSNNSAVHNVVSNIEADILRERYTPAHVFVEAEGVPSHEVGPWPGNPNMIAARGWTWRIPRNPAPATLYNYETPLGQIGTMINGVPMYNTKDGRSYLFRGVWEQDAIWFEGATMDVGLGHPQNAGDYHYHSHPVKLAQQVGQNGVDHSPILGFAFDGYPLYGPYGFSNPDGTGGVRRMESGYAHRNMTQRHTLPDGTQLSQYYWGPDVSASYPLGCYIQDFEYIAGSGDLDEFNGRFCVTPEYPQGTFAYFATIDSSGQPQFPYLLGPTYYGIVDTANIVPGGGHIGVPNQATDWNPFSIYMNDVEAGGTARIAIGNCGAGSDVFFAWSLKGAGPVNTPWGVGSLTPPISNIGPFIASASGFVSTTASVPTTLLGKTIYTQAVSTPPGATSLLSSPSRVTVQ